MGFLDFLKKKAPDTGSMPQPPQTPPLGMSPPMPPPMQTPTAPPPVVGPYQRKPQGSPSDLQWAPLQRQPERYAEPQPVLPPQLTTMQPAEIPDFSDDDLRALEEMAKSRWAEEPQQPNQTLPPLESIALPAQQPAEQAGAPATPEAQPAQPAQPAADLAEPVQPVAEPAQPEQPTQTQPALPLMTEAIVPPAQPTPAEALLQYAQDVQGPSQEAPILPAPVIQAPVALSTANESERVLPVAPSIKELAPAKFISAQTYTLIMGSSRGIRRTLRQSDDMLKDVGLRHEQITQLYKRAANDINAMQECYITIDSELFEEV